MLEISQSGKKKRRNLIIFVHGLIGDDTTWINTSGKTFGDLLLENKEIRRKYDVGYFSYYTKLFDANALVKTGFNFVKKFFGQNKITKINLDINSIKDLLSTEINVKCIDYDNIVLIAHSMGGLIAKSTIIDFLSQDSPSKIKLFISLAVPHNGSNLAQIGKTLSGNVQIKNLEPLSQELNNLTTNWIRTEVEKLPKTIYCQGKYDAVVPQTSSIGIERQKGTIHYFEADHFSISKPESSSSTLLLAVRDALLEFSGVTSLNESLIIQELPDTIQLDDETFVVKLMIASVHHKTINSAKKSFYNAEFIRKLVIAKKIVNVKDFDKLYSLIEGLYINSFGLLTSGHLKDGNALVTHVHSQIQKHDQDILKSIAAITFVHKTGMLHQLANNLEKDLWWEDGHSHKTLEDFRKDKPHA